MYIRLALFSLQVHKKEESENEEEELWGTWCALMEAGRGGLYIDLVYCMTQ
jgi:hypothetical protein